MLEKVALAGNEGVLEGTTVAYIGSNRNVSNNSSTMSILTVVAEGELLGDSKGSRGKKKSGMVPVVERGRA